MAKSLVFNAITIGFLSAVAVSGAGAVTISRTYKFQLDSFQEYILTGNPPPYSILTGSVTVNFDPNLGDIADSTSGIFLNNLSMPLDSPISFSYTRSVDFMFIGGAFNATNGTLFGTNDFVVGFYGASSNPGYRAPAFGAYTSSTDDENGWYTRNGSVAIVPEPVGWAMMVAGFGCVGSALRKRRGDRPARYLKAG